MAGIAAWEDVQTVRTDTKGREVSSQITIDQERKALDELKRIFSTEIQPCFDDLGTCMIAAIVASATLQDLGIPHTCSHVDSYLYGATNPYQGNFRRKTLPRTMWDRAYTTSKNLNKRFITTHHSGGISGHYIVETDNFLVDLSAAQFHLPRLHIETNGPLILPLGDLEEVGHDVWSVPIQSGKYIFCEAENPKEPKCPNYLKHTLLNAAPVHAQRMHGAMYR
jgi:hypothetical protein